MPSITLPAYAKVNLYLDLLRKRPDGYHELLTLFERIDLADQITIEPIPGNSIQFHCDHPDLPNDGTNLVMQAAERYRQTAGWPQGIRITLEKRIPVAAGLGGGSSDAAATLLGLQELSGRRLAEPDLFKIAGRLGADVPFFLAQVPWALGRGRGDEIEPLECPAQLWHLLVYPQFPVPTKSVYQAFRPGGRLTGQGPDVTLLIRALRGNQVQKVRDLLFNALEPTVEALYPALSTVKAAIERRSGLRCPMVSGSGSTVVALCSDRAEAGAAVQRLASEFPSWRVFVSQTK